MVSNVIIDLGPRMLMVGKEALGTSDNISIQVAEATEEELEKLKSAHEIRLVKMLDESGEAKCGHLGCRKKAVWKLPQQGYYFCEEHGGVKKLKSLYGEEPIRLV